MRVCRPLLFALSLVLIFPFGVAAQDSASLQELKRLSLEDLFKQEVTTAGRKPEPLYRAASSIDVLTQERIHRSGATNIPDVLRLAAGLQVARVNSGAWAISARGINLNPSNKMQVLMDGRVLYTPLFSGVFWDVQDYVIDDLDRIEVVRGPGATLWGANAINGVINIISRNAKDTQGVYLQAGGGTEEKDFVTARYGGRAAESTYYRGYFKFFDRDSMVFANGQNAADDWRMGQGGFRIDSDSGGRDSFTLQGDAYRGSAGLENRDDGTLSGANLLGRWTRHYSDTSNLQLQLYYDRTGRTIPLQFQETRNTFDIDLQHRFQVAARNDIVWGFNYRASADQTQNIGTIQFVPQGRTIHLFSGFLQDEISIVPDKLGLILGSKLEGNSYTNLEVQPDARLAWNLTAESTLWAGVSRAVRFPTRIDEDFRFFPLPGLLAIVGNTEFKPEELVALQAGYRSHPHSTFFFDLSTFYHSYDSLISLEAAPPGRPSVIGNGRNARIYGATIQGQFQPQAWLHLIGSVTYLHKKVTEDPGSHDISNAAGEGDDPSYLWSMQAMIDPVEKVQFDFILRSSGELPDPLVPGYTTLDLRVAWQAVTGLELAVVGQNLMQKSHPEFGNDTPLRKEVQRGVYGKVTWTF